MSSMRNAVQRRNHKERAQPKEREKWGILEKHKDYSLRAKDYNEKKKRLKLLKEKAASRNPDEFSFAMLSSKSQAGRKIADRGNQVLDNEAVKLLKTQDAGYLRTMAQKTRKERDRLKEHLAIGESVEALRAGFKSSRLRHIVFVDDANAQKHYEPEEENREPALDADDSNTELRLDMKPWSGSSKSREKKDQSKVATLHDAQLLKRRRKRELQARAARLEALKEREKTLVIAEMELEIQRARMQNSIGSVTKDGTKFKARIRKR